MLELKKLRGSMVLLLVAAAAGCGGDDGDISSGGGDDGPAKAGSACEVRNETRACTCDDLKGSQACQAGGWSECECQLAEGGTVKGSTKKPEDGSSIPAGNLRTDIKFDWQRTDAVEGSCEPGYYEGTFSGLYNSQITVVGVPIPVTAVSLPGKPGLSFTLTKKAGSGEELVIENGVMDGLADGAFPFKGTLTGTLDCQTLKFDAILDGYYSLGLDGIGQWFFKGPLLADYDKTTRSVINATWDVKEYKPPPPMTVIPLGGQGTWSATWLHP
jgi:hypothetical protein